MVETLCTSGALKDKAGANMNATIKADDAILTRFINQAEGNISVRTRKDWVAVFTSLNDSVKKILEEGCSNLAAMYAIQYDMSGFTSRTESQTMLDVLQDGYLRVLGILNDKKNRTFIEGA